LSCVNDRGKAQNTVDRRNIELYIPFPTLYKLLSSAKLVEIVKSVLRLTKMLFIDSYRERYPEIVLPTQNIEK